MPAVGGVYRSGDWEIDLTRRELRLRGAPVPLGARALEILETLVRADGEVVTKDDILELVWPGAAVGENTLQVHMSAVRKALGADRDMLRTAFGRGYRLLGDWKPQAREPEEVLETGPADIIRTHGLSEQAVFFGNLPFRTSELIGRAAIVAQLHDLLSAHRVVTLTGPGGIGKTVLALEVARSLAATFEDDAWFVELISLSDPNLVPSAVAGALSIALGTAEMAPEAVARAIGERKTLIVLDNCEHVIDVAARVVEAVVRICPRASILATSQEVLRIDGEYVFRVPPLEVPSGNQEEAADILGLSAVQLFIARIKTQVSNFSPQSDDLRAIAAICRRLDGIPLAIELAAARAATLGTSEVAARLDDCFGILTGGRRTALPRHQTLRAALDWSYGLLPAAERRLLNRLAAFPAGFTLDAAAAVVADAPDPALAAVDGIANLVSKSLITTDGSISTERWRLLDTVRAYALEKLVDAGESDQTTRRVAQFFRDLFAAESSSGVHAEGDDTLEFGQELDNVRAALDWAFSETGDRELGIDLTAKCAPLWMRLSLLGECRSRVESALTALDQGAGNGAATEMLLRAALGTSLAYTRGPVDAAKSAWTRVLEPAESLGDTEYQLRALYGLWLYNILVCQYRVALELAQRFQLVAEQIDHTPDIPTADRMMAMVLHYLGDQAGARARATRSLDAPLPANRDVYTARYGVDQRVGALVQLARALWLQGLPDQAIRAAQASVDEARLVRHTNSLCLALADGVCIVALLTGNYAEAEYFASMLAEHADKHALDVWRTYGRAVRGRLHVRNGHAGAGATLLRSALADLRDTPSDIRFQLYHVWLAEVLGAAGRVTEALGAIDEALERAEQTEERWYLPELWRIRGELLLQSSPQEARETFTRALHIAQSQNALSWELRTTMSIVRMPDGELNPIERRAMLLSVLARFQEGFGTADLMGAQQLLSELSG